MPPYSTVENERATRGCWTCKERKIGCDKALPGCDNCKRTHRTCHGYGLRLVWPDQPDGRRKADALAVHETNVAPATPDHPQYGRYFLNVFISDIMLDEPSPTLFVARRPAPELSRPLLAFPGIQGQQAMLLQYYESQITSLISTLHAENGFQTTLLPMALHQCTDSAEALRYAMMAIAGYHRSSSTSALSYRMKAIRSLRNSLASRKSDEATAKTELAASMMLGVYSVFDEGEGHWHVHLDGARHIWGKLSNLGRDPTDRGLSFLAAWFLYHETLGRFTRPLKGQSDDHDVWHELDLYPSNPMLIVGSLGCSLEILELIAKINQIRALPLSERTQPNAYNYRHYLETRLRDASQHLESDHDRPEDLWRRKAILATAELYRLGAILYLQRVCPLYDEVEDHRRRMHFLGQAFNALAILEVATSPWPIFIIACESHTDEQRVAILHTIDKMNISRRIGNINTMRQVIEAFWKHKDLNSNSVDWLNLVTSDYAVPWFV